MSIKQQQQQQTEKNIPNALIFMAQPHCRAPANICLFMNPAPWFPVYICLCVCVCVCRCVGVLMWFSKNTYFKVPSASQMIWLSLPEVHCFVAAVSFSASGFARLFNSIFILIISVVICFRPCPTSHLALVSSFVKFNEHSECRKWKAAFPQPAQSAMSLTNVWMNA